jgi:predicted nucleic acid-binding protein
MPGVRVFIDSNVFLYTRDADSPQKSGTCSGWVKELTARRLGIVNLQVLNEVTNVMLRKRREFSAEKVFSWADELRQFGETPIGNETTRAARKLHLDSGYSWWDCLLLGSALELGCSHFLSEDLQDGQKIGGLTIINPFTHAPEEILEPVQE